VRSPEDLAHRIEIINQGADDEGIDWSQIRTDRAAVRFAAKFVEILRRRFGLCAVQGMTRGFVSALRRAANVFAIEVFDGPCFNLCLQLLNCGAACFCQSANAAMKCSSSARSSSSVLWNVCCEVRRVISCNCRTVCKRTSASRTSEISRAMSRNNGPVS